MSLLSHFYSSDAELKLIMEQYSVFIEHRLKETEVSLQRFAGVRKSRHNIYHSTLFVNNSSHCKILQLIGKFRMCIQSCQNFGFGKY